MSAAVTIRRISMPPDISTPPITRSFSPSSRMRTGDGVTPTSSGSILPSRSGFHVQNRSARKPQQRKEGHGTENTSCGSRQRAGPHSGAGHGHGHARAVRRLRMPLYPALDMGCPGHSTATRGPVAFCLSQLPAHRNPSSRAVHRVRCRGCRRSGEILGDAQLHLPPPAYPGGCRPRAICWSGRSGYAAVRPGYGATPIRETYRGGFSERIAQRGAWNADVLYQRRPLSGVLGTGCVRIRAELWPSLPYEAWKDTRDTLHMWTQIVGKVRMELSPFLNHWWHVTLYVTPRGLTTSAI